MIFVASVVEGNFGAFQNIHDVLVRSLMFDRAGIVGDFRAVFPLETCIDDLLRVAHDSQIGVVRNHDDLAKLFRLVYDRNKQTHDRLIVEIFLRLIENDGVPSLIDQKIEDEKKRATLARR